MSDLAEDKLCSNVQSWEGESTYWEMAKGEEIEIVAMVSVGSGLPFFLKSNLNIFVSVSV